MSHSRSSGIGPPAGDTGRSYQQAYASGHYQNADGADRHRGRSSATDQQYYAARSGEREDTRRTASGKYGEEYRKTGSDKGKQGRHSQSDGRTSPAGGGRYAETYNSSRSAQSHQPQQPQLDQPYAPTTGQMRSGHLEIDSLYSGNSGPLEVNSMNAPNNSTVQCGCENIDCPFCNLMMSVQMKQ